MKARLLFLAAALTLAACDQKGSTDSTKERAGAEQEAARDVENRNLAAKAERMERDLAHRHFFYSALEGRYDGSVKVGNRTFAIRITLSKSLAPYAGDRVRQLSEIESELNNLFFHAQVIQWNPADPNTAFGCRVSQLRPDMTKGIVKIESAECTNRYEIYLGDGEADSFEQRRPRAARLAGLIRSKEVDQVNHLIGTIQPTTIPQTYTFTAKRAD